MIIPDRRPVRPACSGTSRRWAQGIYLPAEVNPRGGRKGTRVKVLLLHNPTSGEEHPAPHALVRAFEDAGHAVRYQSTKDEDWERALETPVEVIIAAGGDGTVRRGATVLGRRTTGARA